jgi:hypothetical protein
MSTTTVNRLTMDLSLERCGCELKTTLLCKYINCLMNNLSIFVNIFEIYLVIQSL